MLEANQLRNASWLRNIDDNFSSRHTDAFYHGIVGYTIDTDGFTSDQVETIQNAVNTVDELVDVDFAYFGDNDQNTDDKDGSLDFFTGPLDPFTGFTHNGSGDIQIDNNDNYEPQFEGLIFHELGHAMGLSHPDDRDDADGWPEEPFDAEFHEWDNMQDQQFGPDGNEIEINGENTIMRPGSLIANKLGWMDVQALQFLHGLDDDGFDCTLLEAGENLVTGQDGTYVDAGGREHITFRDGVNATVRMTDDTWTSDKITVEGEAEEFVFSTRQDDDDHALAVYDDDGTAIEVDFPRAQDFYLEFAPLDGSDGAAEDETYGSVKVYSVDADDDGQIDEIEVGGVPIVGAGQDADVNDMTVFNTVV